MKTGAMTVALLFLISFLGVGCSTVNRLNTEYEEETARVEQMSPEEKAEYQKSQPFAIEWSDIDRDGDGDSD